MPRITGTVVAVDHGTRPGQDQAGNPIVVNTTTVHVLDGREVVPVRLGQNFDARFGEGEVVDLYVVFRAWKGRSGDANVTVTALRPWVDSPATLALASGS